MNSAQALWKTDNTDRRKLLKCLHLCDLQSPLSHEVSGVRPNEESGQAEPEWSLRAQAVSHLLLYLWHCTRMGACFTGRWTEG